MTATPDVPAPPRAPQFTHPDLSVLISPDDEFAVIRPGVTMEMAKLAAMHAIVVQGGFTTPEVEADRLAADIAERGLTPAQIAESVALWRIEIAAAHAARTADVTEAVNVDGEDVKGQIDMALVRRFKELHARHRAADEEADALKAELDDAEAAMVKMYQDAEVPSMSVDGKTLYLNRKTFAQRKPGVTTEDLKDALRAAGAADLITETIHAQTLSAYVREFYNPDVPRPMPPEVEAVLELGERLSIGVTAAGRKGRTSTKPAASSAP